MLIWQVAELNKNEILLFSKMVASLTSAVGGITLTFRVSGLAFGGLLIELEVLAVFSPLTL